jgi:DNA invertase Pin-like site-specific DNA recombinase
VLIGYARTSTDEQVAGFEAQLRELESLAGGSDRVKIFKERVSSVARERPQLEAMIDYVRDGDEVIVTRLDRLARSVADMVDIVRRIRAKGATIRLPGIGTINGDDPTSELLLNVLAAIAQFERQIMLARQREGIAKAKGEGKYKGRAPTARRQAERIRELAAGGMRKEDIADQLAVSRSSVYRILQEGNEAAASPLTR